MPPDPAKALGAFLRDRRSQLNPATFGFSSRRRRTPGLRREEVAQRADISPTWYAWLEQGRGGAPSVEVLDRLCRSLMLTEAEREHLFMLAIGRPPQIRYQATSMVTPRLQRLLDSLDASPAIIKTATWDVIAWNRAAALVLTDYATLAPQQRNILRLVFGNSRIKSSQEDWEALARFLVAAFRADLTRAGATEQAHDLIAELSAMSPEFDRLWHGSDVEAHGEGNKRLRHPQLGMIELEYSSFAVDGRPDLGLIVYQPVEPEVRDRIRAFVGSSQAE